MDEIELQLTAEQCTAVSYNLFRVSPLTALGLKLLTSCIPARFGASTISGGLYFYFFLFFHWKPWMLLCFRWWYGMVLDYEKDEILGGWRDREFLLSCNFCFQVLVIILWQGTGHKHCTWHMVLGFLPSVMMFCRKTKANLNFKEQFLKIVLNYF